jgi:protein-disulfide isomerase
VRSLLPAFAVLVLLPPCPVRAQTPACDRLQGAQLALARQILDREHPYDCCDDTIAACLRKTPACTLAVRLAESVCRWVGENKDQAAILRALAQRYRSMMPGAAPRAIDLANTPTVGSESAPVIAVLFACGRCPLCAQLTPQLHQAVTQGPLAGKVRLALKVFPIRSHPHSREVALAMLAADTQGKFWDFALYADSHFVEFSPEKLPEWAASAGLERARFEIAFADPATRERLLNLKKEGLALGVSATPTLFINGRPYSGALGIEDLVDVLQEELERLSGRTHRSP